MPRVKTTSPMPSRHKQEINLDIPTWLWRVLPPYRNPGKLFEANVWRDIVASQPIAMICRDTIIDNYLSKDWKIEPRESDKRDELKEDTKYYTKFITNTGDYEYTEIVDWIGKDLLDTSFGGAAEIGRTDFDEKVYWIELLDAATLYPTLNDDHPVGQAMPEYPLQAVYFPDYTIDRIMYSPITKIKSKGWGLTPPMKVYLALESLNRGDIYYANLLLDTPEAGILDLGDMSKKSAEEWIKAFREMLGGIDPLKIPILYEHNNEVRFVPFNRPPLDLMFDRMMLKYAAIVAAGYGVGLSDIGIQGASGGGETLAGSIRQERKTRNTGFARFKKKIKAFFDYILPETLEYTVIDQDEELSVAIGRARLANATAAGQLIDLGIFSPEEMRLQTIADGLISISVPEKIPPEAKPKPQFPAQQFPPGGQQPNKPERPGLLGKPIAPSQGGYGEVLPNKKSDVFSEEMNRIASVDDVHLRRLIRGVIKPLLIEAKTVMEELDESLIDEYNDWYDEVLWGNLTEEVPELVATTVSQSKTNLARLMGRGETWWKLSISGEDVYEDFDGILMEAIDHKYRKQAEIAYEQDKTDKVEVSTIDYAKYSEALKAKIFDIIGEIDNSFPDAIQKCIICGTRKALTRTDLLEKSLDEEGIVNHNKMIEYVRQELIDFANDTIDNFAGRLSNTIKELVEE